MTWQLKNNNYTYTRTHAYICIYAGSIPAWEDPLEEGMATHSSILAWRIPWTEKPGRLWSTGCKELDTTVRHPGMWSQVGLSITTNKASGGDWIQVELFQILKDDAVKVLHSICQQIWKTHSAVATGLEKVSFHSNPKERQCQRMLKLPHNCTHLTC